jgi:hypothetical protein
MPEGGAGEPASFAGLQHDPRGLPIPIHVGRPPNKPVDITSYDRSRLILITAQRRCTICGWKIPAEELCWYVSEPGSMAELGKPGKPKWDEAAEGVGHKECMLYAAVTCPWLSAGPDYKRKTPQRAGEVIVAARGTARGELVLVGLPRALIRITPANQFNVIVGGGNPEIVPFERGAELMPVLVELLGQPPREPDADDRAFVELLRTDDEIGDFEVLAGQTMLELTVQMGEPIRAMERNQHCPCRSGRKAKQCCLPRIERMRERMRNGEVFEERLAVSSQ